MANEKQIAGAYPSTGQPIVRTIGMADIKDALAKGIDDFKAKPSHVVFLCLLYPVIGLILWRATLERELLSLLFPLVAGYALVGPIAATGLYEISRRREQGLDVSWRHAFDVVRSPSIGAIALVSAGLVALFVIWLATAQAIYEIIFDTAVPVSIAELAGQVFTTSSGLILIIVGCGVGFLFAVVVLTVGVVSFPLLLDRDVGAAVAVQTSVRAVLANPMTVAMWGLIVAGALVIGSLPLFIGLAVVLPVLGHSTWHLYRKIVEH